jgi:hypothetical protein
LQVGSYNFIAKVYSPEHPDIAIKTPFSVVIYEIPEQNLRKLQTIPVLDIPDIGVDLDSTGLEIPDLQKILNEGLENINGSLDPLKQTWEMTEMLP